MSWSDFVRKFTVFRRKIFVWRTEQGRGEGGGGKVVRSCQRRRGEGRGGGSRWRETVRERRTHKKKQGRKKLFKQKIYCLIIGIDTTKT
jgi:hypothetical protein